MGQELAGKVAIITGGASGIGEASVEAFVNEGAKVVFADVNAELGENLARKVGDNARFKQTDVSKPEQVQALVDYAIEQFGGLHIMFNNAGISGKHVDRFLEDDFEDFDKVIGVNLLGVIKGCQFAGRHMAKNGGGVILNNASIAGLLPGYALSTYRASKSAVVMLSKSIAIDLAEHNIRVNCLAPGHIRSPLTSFALPGMDDAQVAAVKEAVSPAMDSNMPLKRHGRPIDVANVAVFLCSDKAAQVTGVIMPVDGGITAGDPVNHLKEIIDARTQALAQFS